MITEDRYESVSLSIPYNSDGWVMASLAPKILENKHAVVQPFRVEVKHQDILKQDESLSERSVKP